MGHAGWLRRCEPSGCEQLLHASASEADEFLDESDLLGLCWLLRDCLLHRLGQPMGNDGREVLGMPESQIVVLKLRERRVPSAWFLLGCSKGAASTWKAKLLKMTGRDTQGGPESLTVAQKH